MVTPTITATKATGAKNVTQTNGVGVYRFVAVEPGKYDVEFSHPGFETRKIGDVEVTVHVENDERVDTGLHLTE